MDRREFVGLLALGAAATLAGCGGPFVGVAPTLIPDPQFSDPFPNLLNEFPTPTPTPPAFTPGSPLASPAVSPSHSIRPSATPVPAVTGVLGPIPPARVGKPEVFSGGSAKGGKIVLSIDDGYNAEVVAAYVEFAQRSGIALNFCPNGAYRGVWDGHAKTLRPLVAAGQVQFGNHTFSHQKIINRRASLIRSDIERNDDWIQTKFGVTSRPYLRPPYGWRDATSDEICASLGYTSVLLWNGSFGDSTVQSSRTIMNLARRYLVPGTVMLGHANHPAIIPLLPMIQELITSRGLHPVTLDRMFGTSRRTG